MYYDDNAIFKYGLQVCILDAHFMDSRVVAWLRQRSKLSLIFLQSDD